MHTVEKINFVFMCLFFACYLYQFLYIPVSWLPAKTSGREAPLHRFAVLIAARNEEAVIGNLIESIKAQRYPEGLIQIFVAADNCQDATARIAGVMGATVFERQDREHRGKGYARMLVGHISRELLAQGVTPMLYADARNPASNRAYRNTGFVPCGEITECSFRSE